MRFGLKGKLADGVFPREKVIEVHDLSGRPVSVIVQDDQVRKIDGHGALEVTLLERGGGAGTVMLPGEVYGATRTIQVPESDLLSFVT
jgi:hypothetical protein